MAGDLLAAVFDGELASGKVDAQDLSYQPNVASVNGGDLRD